MIFAAVQNLLKVTGDKNVKLSVCIRLKGLTENILIYCDRFQSEEDTRAVSKLANDYVNFCKECCLYASVSLATLSKLRLRLTSLDISKTYREQNSCNTMRNTIAACGHAFPSLPYCTFQNQVSMTPRSVMS